MTERIILRRPVTAREYTAFENRASAAGVEKVGMIENTIMLSSIVPGFFILPKGTDATENEWGGLGGVHGKTSSYQPAQRFSKRTKHPVILRFATTATFTKTFCKCIEAVTVSIVTTARKTQ